MRLTRDRMSTLPENLAPGQKLYNVRKPTIRQVMLWRKDFGAGEIETVTFVSERGMIAGERAVVVKYSNGAESAQYARIFTADPKEAVVKLQEARAGFVATLAEWIAELQKPVEL